MAATEDKGTTTRDEVTPKYHNKQTTIPIHQKVASIQHLQKIVTIGQKRDKKETLLKSRDF